MESKRKPAEKRRLHHLYQAAGGEGIVVDAVVETDVPEVSDLTDAGQGGPALRAYVPRLARAVGVVAALGV